MEPDSYPHADLVPGYISRRGVKTFHTAKPDRTGNTGCGLTVAELIEAGWARGLRRQGLEHCAKCSKAVDLDAALTALDGDALEDAE